MQARHIHLETFLTGLDGGDITGNATTDDDQILLFCLYHICQHLKLMTVINDCLYIPVSVAYPLFDCILSTRYNVEGEARKVLLTWLAGRTRGRDVARSTECLNMAGMARVRWRGRGMCERRPEVSGADLLEVKRW